MDLNILLTAFHNFCLRREYHKESTKQHVAFSVRKQKRSVGCNAGILGRCTKAIRTKQPSYLQGLAYAFASAYKCNIQQGKLKRRADKTQNILPSQTLFRERILVAFFIMKYLY
jgi:hypothetical protein